MKKKHIFFLLILLSSPLFASGGESDITHRMMNLAIQLGVIIFAAKFIGRLFSKIGMPSVLGELIAGILIGPYLLGHIPLPGFEHGIFPIIEGSIPVMPELYGIAQVASIILLFHSGLETDLNLFLRYSLKGAVVGISGVLASFGTGAFTAMTFFDLPFMHPTVLFLGVLSIATSVGITARILSEQRKMDSPEGVTIIAAAVIDDVLGIILLAIVVGIIGVLNGGTGEIDWGEIRFIAGKAVMVWLLFTIAGLIFAAKISAFLKLFRDKINIAVAGLALALIIAGIFESAGLALIIGAYVLGLSLSKTDISFVIQEAIHPIAEFVVPVFFCVMGMMVDLGALFSKEVLIFGGIYTVVAVLSKLLGCAVPSLFLRFNTLGALRVGAGMVPRGEVALIIAGIGAAKGILDPKMFGVAVLMTLISTILPPPLLAKLLKIKKPGTKGDIKGTNTLSTTFDFPSREITDLAVVKITSALKSEGFFTHFFELDGDKVYQMRKDNIFFTMHHQPQVIEFISDKEDLVYVKNIVYESLLDLNETIKKLQEMAKPEEMQKDLLETDSESRKNYNLIKTAVLQENIIMELNSDDKEGVLGEMVKHLVQNGVITNEEEVLKGILDREEIMSTGMQYGIALPHCKTDLVDSVKTVVAFKKEGVDFDALDGQPSTIFVLIISPESNPGPHIQFLSAIGSILNDEETREKLFHCITRQDVKDTILNKAQG